MIKALARGNGKTLIVFGLAMANIDMLKQGRPILLNLKDLDESLGDEKVVISYRDEHGRCEVPNGYKGILMAFGDETLKVMHNAPQYMDAKGFHFAVYCGKDEAAMEYELRSFGLISHKTKVTSKGIPPSQKPVIAN